MSLFPFTTDNSAILKATKGQRHARKLLKQLLVNCNTDEEPITCYSVIVRLFWLFIYISGAVLTVLSLVDLYHRTQDGPFSLSSVAIRLDSIKLVDATICLQIRDFEKLLQRLLLFVEKARHPQLPVVKCGSEWQRGVPLLPDPAPRRRRGWSRIPDSGAGFASAANPAY